jgi:microsomal dipeptidase-like Zn-dependent dipeptidase
LTEAGVELLTDMAAIGMRWDISHLTEEGIWQGFSLGIPNVCASHANARALLPTDRHLSDEVIGAIGGRGGVVGLAAQTDSLLRPHQDSAEVGSGRFQARTETKIGAWAYPSVRRP